MGFVDGSSESGERRSLAGWWQKGGVANTPPHISYKKHILESLQSDVLSLLEDHWYHCIYMSWASRHRTVLPLAADILTPRYYSLLESFVPPSTMPRSASSHFPHQLVEANGCHRPLVIPDRPAIILPADN